MAEPPSAVDVARKLADALETAGLPYAVGGALALGYYAVPRATVDVDINVFVPPDRDLPRVLAVLDRVGFASDADRAVLERQAREDGQFRGYVEGLRVDVFVPAIEYYAELAGRRQQVEMLGRPAWILGPEDLILLKMMFYRRKDLADVESLLREQLGSLDLDFVRTRLGQLVGERDERIEALDEIVRDVGGA